MPRSLTPRIWLHLLFDLDRPCLHRFQVGAEEFDGILPFDARHGFFHIVLNHL